MNKNKYLLKNSAIFAIGNIGTKLINFFLVPYYTYVLSSEQYGTVDLLFTVCSLIIPVVMCNINEAVMRFLMDKNGRDDEVGSVAVCFMMFGAAGGLILIPIFLLVTLTRPYVLEMYLYIILNAAHSIVFYYLRGKEELMKYAICSILTTIFIALFNVGFLTFLNAGIKGYFWAYDISYLITIVIAIIWGKEYQVISNFKIEKRMIKSMFRFSIALVPNALLWWMINSSDRIMVSTMVGLSANGLYGVSYKIPSLLTTLSNIFMQAWTYSAISEKNENAGETYTNYVFDNLFGLMALVSGGLLLLNKVLFKFLFSASYFEAWKYSPSLIFGFFFLTMATFIGTSYYVEKNTVGTMLSALVGAVINIVLNFLLIPRVGTNGAAIATGLSYLAIFVYRYYDTQKYIKIEIFKRKYLFTVVLLIVLLLSGYLSDKLVSFTCLLAFVILCFVQRKLITQVLKIGIQMTRAKR